MVTMQEILADEVLDSAYAWPREQRWDWLPIAKVSSLRRRWAREKARLHADLLESTFRVRLLSRVTLKDQQDIDLWSARDVLGVGPSRGHRNGLGRKARKPATYQRHLLPGRPVRGGLLNDFVHLYRGHEDDSVVPDAPGGVDH